MAIVSCLPPRRTPPCPDSANFMARNSMARRGLTLVEMLVAMTVSLLMVYGMVLAFEKIGAEISDGRAVIEMANMSRSVINRLRQDLDGVTVPVRPWNSPEPPQGYFEYVEGSASDDPREAIRSFGSTPALDLLGDIDDVLMFTSRDMRDKFVGNVGDLMLTSDLAEVIWFTRWLDADGDNAVDETEVTLHRRALLIRPDTANRVTPTGNIVDDNGAVIPTTTDPRIKAFTAFALTLFGDPSALPAPVFKTWNIGSEMIALRNAIETFNQNCDVSVRWQVTLRNGGADIAVLPSPNSLSDLGDRSNRYCHFPICFTDAAGAVTCLPQVIAAGAAWPAISWGRPLTLFPAPCLSIRSKWCPTRITRRWPAPPLLPCRGS